MDYLNDAGVTSVFCKKLDQKGDFKCSTSAFMVSCDQACEVLLYDESTWPLGCELRPWVFKEKKPVDG